ncbi:hypothetical protein C8J56DRAFT_953332 [Mycena floridula]|nr:hypothetical protein C8J56DRAFT_953332 [Mycena floridula]
MPFCYICDGPIDSMTYCDREYTEFHQMKPDVWRSFHEMPELTEGDEQWLTTAAVIYADCISPRGQIHHDFFLRPYTNQKRFHYASEPDLITDILVLKPEDPVHVPDWACEHQPGMAKYQDVDGSYIAHDLCIRLAAEWSRALFPSRFDKLGALTDGRTDPSKFLWNLSGPCQPFFCDAIYEEEDEATRAFAKASAITLAKLGDLQTVRLSLFWSKGSPCGYIYVQPPWRIEDDYDDHAMHRRVDGITHLKRPDCFPDIYPIAEPIAFIPIQALFPSTASLPLEIILYILLDVVNDIDHASSDIFSLENASHVWRDLLRTPLVQRHIWLKHVKDVGFTPNAADWTESAERIRVAMDQSELDMDWRRFFFDARKSLHMKNRLRIKKEVLLIDHGLGNCNCIIAT